MPTLLALFIFLLDAAFAYAATIFAADADACHAAAR